MSKQRFQDPELEALASRLRGKPMSEQELEEQRRSFAYGNAAIENSAVTRDLVDMRADAKKRGLGR